MAQDIKSFNGKSKVWKYFGFYAAEEGGGKLDKTKSVCKICRKEVPYKDQTTNMFAHLNKHPEVNVVETPSLQQPSIAAYSQTKMQLTCIRAKEITSFIANYIIDDLRPLSTIDSDSFRKLIAALEPKYPTPSRTYLTQNVLPNMFNKLVKSLHEELENVESVGLTHDMWSSLNTESYGTFTAQYINSDFEMKCKVLHTRKLPGQHTSEAIAESLQACKDEWGLKHIIRTTDNAANKVKAFQLLGWVRVGCMGHNINLAVRQALKVPRVNHLVSKGRNLVSYFHRSNLAMDVLLEKQKLLLDKQQQGHKLIGDCVTRWNSTYDMLVRLVEQTPALHAAASDPRLANANLKVKVYTFTEHSLEEKVAELLKSFKGATVRLSSESLVTSSIILPSYVKFEKELVVQEDDDSLIVEMKAGATKDFQKRQNFSFEQKKVLVLASVLDPRTKSMAYLTKEEKVEGKNLLLEELKLVAANATRIKREQEDSPVDPDETQDTTLPAAKKIKTEVKEEHDLEWLDDVIFVAAKAGVTTVPDVERELEASLAEPQIKSEPLVWWKDRKHVFPHLAVLARKYLCFPASSVSSERVFSMAGNLVTKKRSMLSPDNIDMLIFLNKNSK